MFCQLGSPFSQPKITFKYLGVPNKIGGRGGVTRFFFLIYGIKYEEELYDFTTDAWPNKKREILASGENPAGSVPIVIYGSKVLTQHMATIRYIALELGLGSTSWGNYIQDVIVDEYQFLRDAWVVAAFMGGDKEKFLALIKDKLTVFNALYDKYAMDEVFMSCSLKSKPMFGKAVGKPLWGDIALFGLVRDLIIMDFITKDELPSRILKMYDCMMTMPEIANWCEA